MGCRRNRGIERRSRVWRRKSGQIWRQRRGGIDLGISVIHGQVNNGQRARAERGSGLLSQSIRMADTVGFEGDCIPEEGWSGIGVPFE